MNLPNSPDEIPAFKALIKNMTQRERADILARIVKRLNVQLKPVREVIEENDARMDARLDADVVSAAATRDVLDRLRKKKS